MSASLPNLVWRAEQWSGVQAVVSEILLLELRLKCEWWGEGRTVFWPPESRHSPSLPSVSPRSVVTVEHQAVQAGKHQTHSDSIQQL